MPKQQAMPSQNHGRTDRKSKPVSGSVAVSGAGEGVLLITVVTGDWISGSASGVCTGAGTSRSAGEKSSGAAGVWERLICCCTCATGSALGCRLRSLWIWKGISSRSPASSQSRQIYFRGVFFQHQPQQHDGQNDDAAVEAGRQDVLEQCVHVRSSS